LLRERQGWGRRLGESRGSAGRHKAGPTKKKQDVPAAEAAGLAWWDENLWGRVYPGQRGWGRCLGVGRGPIGRHKAGPTKKQAGRACRRRSEIGPLGREPVQTV